MPASQDHIGPSTPDGGEPRPGAASTLRLWAPPGEGGLRLWDVQWLGGR